jgi:hypothetical protein
MRGLPTIEITPATYEKLQRLGVAFVDTPESVIARLVDAALEKKSAVSRESIAGPLDPSVIDLDPFFTGNLAHTRVRRASFGAREIDPPKWNNLLRTAHVEARKQLGSFDALKEATSARIRQGPYDREGFKFVPGSDFSIQGLDSNMAWSSSLRLAKKLNVPIEIEFEWYNKEGAAHPGKRGRMVWNPD